MDTLCGLGLPEIILILLLSFALIGPERTQEVALNAGRLLRRVVRSDWWREVNEITRAMKDLPTTLVRMAEIEETQKELRETMREINDLTRGEIDGARRDLGEATRDINQAARDQFDAVQQQIDSLRRDRDASAPTDQAEG